MPNIKSAAKRVKTAAKANLRNRSVKSELLTYRKKMEAAFVAGDKDAAKEAVRVYASKLDKAAKKGVIKRNTADRKKSRSALAFAKMAYGRTPKNDKPLGTIRAPSGFLLSACRSRSARLPASAPPPPSPATPNTPRPARGRLRQAGAACVAPDAGALETRERRAERTADELC